MTRSRTRFSAHRLRQSTHVTPVTMLLLGLIVLSVSVFSRVRAGSIDADVTVSLIVQEAASSSAGGTGGGGQSPQGSASSVPRGSLRPESLLLRIISNTFTQRRQPAPASSSRRSQPQTQPRSSSSRPAVSSAGAPSSASRASTSSAAPDQSGSQARSTAGSDPSMPTAAASSAPRQPGAAAVSAVIHHPSAGHQASSVVTPDPSAAMTSDEPADTSTSTVSDQKNTTASPAPASQSPVSSGQTASTPGGNANDGGTPVTGGDNGAAATDGLIAVDAGHPAAQHDTDAGTGSRQTSSDTADIARCGADPTADGCDPYTYCTLWSAHCIARGVYDDTYSASFGLVRAVSSVVLWACGGEAVVSIRTVFWLVLVLLAVIGCLCALLWRRHDTKRDALPGVPRHLVTCWYAMNMAITAVLLLLALFLLWESTHAQSATVGITVIGTDIGLSCTSPVALGTLTVNGDSGVYSGSRATTCTIVTNNPAGYSLTWRVSSGSGGTATGRLISQHNDLIEPFTPAAAGTPEAWSVNATDAEWGGRVSTDSTTVSAAAWGTDGISERWLNVATGSAVIVNRPTPTAGSGDSEYIGFRAEIGGGTSRPAGTYSATVIFTAITN